MGYHLKIQENEWAKLIKVEPVMAVDSQLKFDFQPYGWLSQNRYSSSVKALVCLAFRP